VRVWGAHVVALVVLGLPPGTAFTRAGDLAASETAVFEAVFRQQIQEHLDVSARGAGTVICLAINPGGAPQSPGRELMARFAARRDVRRAAECDPRPSGAVEAMTLRPAVVVTAGPIEWIAEDEAWVTVIYFRSALLSAERRYRVVHEPAGWVSLGQILRDGPLQRPPTR
jgi:hypothetical protein